MNALLRRPARLVFNRRYATASTPYVPPASLKDLAPPAKDPRRDPKLVKPDSPSFYTGRPSYYDGLVSLQDAIHTTSHILRNLSLLPLPEFARASLPQLQPVWKAKVEMASVFETALSTARYRRATAMLNQLNDYRRIADTAGVPDLVEAISHVLAMFEKTNKEQVLNRGKRKPVKFDDYGRTYTLGKRKESAARVWMIPVQPLVPTSPEQSAEASSGGVTDILNLSGSGPAVMVGEKAPESKAVGAILVNNLPLSTYFPLPADRERIVRPLKVAGVLGAFNVFALVRGGGTSGQSGAVAHGLAKGLAAHVPDVELILRRGTS